jgi:hypothetical protein
MRLAFGDDLPGISSECPTRHHRDLLPLFDAPRFEQYPAICGQGVPKAHLALSRVRTASLQKQPIGHHIIQHAEQDTSMRDSIVPAVLG